jgi:hypothetical protein
MAIKKFATSKVAMSVEPDPVDQQDGGAGDVSVIVPEQADAPVPTGGHAPGTLNTTPDGPQLPSTIAVPVGSSGFYSGARPYEDLAAYDARLGSAADTFGDLGWILGTKPKV